MTDKNWTKEELIELWLTASDAQATDEQREALNRLVIEDANARKELIALSQQQAWLMWHGSKIDAEDSRSSDVAALAAYLQDFRDEKGVPLNNIAPPLSHDESCFGGTSAQSNGGWFGNLSTPFFAFCLGAVIATGVVVLVKRDGATIAKQTPENGTTVAVKDHNMGLKAATPVAVLASAESCNWGGDSWMVGNELPLGSMITLHEGIAEFKLTNETSRTISINVEGPAAVVFTSPTSLVVRYGKLTATIPWATTDFTLLAGTCTITSRSAEFGVNVVDNIIDVHTFSGEVSVARSPFAGKSEDENLLDDDLSIFPIFEPVVVGEGKAVLFRSDKNGLEPPNEHKIDRTQFATNVSMSHRLAVTSKYVESVLKLRPISYWRFESIQGKAIKNEVESGPSLEIRDGNVALSGDANNKFANLGLPENGGYFLSNRALTGLSNSAEYTVECWAKPSHFQQGMIASFMTWPSEQRDGYGKVSMVMELQRPYGAGRGFPGTIRFTHRNPPGHTGGKSCYSNTLYRLREWQHIVAVKQNSTLQLYLNGERVAIDHDKSRLVPGDHHIMIGQAYIDEQFPAWKRAFVGQLDEFAVYPRALSTSEIMKHFKMIDSRTREQSEKNESEAKNLEL